MKKLPSLCESYSKLISTIFMICYLFGIAVGTYAVIIDPTNIDPLLIYIGGSTTIATSFYFWKARAENLIKIKGFDPDIYKDVLSAQSQEDADETPVD